MKKIYTISILGISVLALIFGYVYYLNFDLTINTFESALNSFIVNLVVLVFTVIVINVLFSYKHERINKQKEYDDYVEVLNESHNSLVSSLKTYIISFVIKKEAPQEPDENNKLQHSIRLTDLKDDLDKYITPYFFTIPNQVTESGQFTAESKFIEQKHTDWLLENNNKILARIHKYLMLYSKLMPNNMLKLLVEIELLITRESVFMVLPSKKDQDLMNKNVLINDNEKDIQAQIAKVIDKIIEFEKVV